LQVEVSAESGLACLTVSWNDGTLPEHAPCSRPELGLLIAQAGLEQAGAECRHSQIERRHAYVVRLPLVADLPEGATSQFGGVK
jgi:hypothetical protein